MSQYTTELRYLVQQHYDIGLKDYPLFDEGYRNVLNKKIVDEYFFREIGQETPERFRHYLNHTMNMIMPYYNQLYQSQLLEIDPLLTYRDEETMRRTIDTDTGNTASEVTIQDRDTVADTTENQTGHAEFESTSIIDADATVSTLGTETTDEDTTNTKTENKFGVHSATPGGMISVGDIKTHTWADDAKIDEGTTGDVGTNDRTVTVDNDVTSSQDQTTTNTGSSDNTNGVIGKRTEAEDLNKTVNDTRSGTVDTVDEYLKKKFGFTGNQSKLLTEYRKTFLNIDAMIVKELNVLFMGIY